jgi:hypothetical protein
MYVREKDGVIYVYRSMEMMLYTMQGYSVCKNQLLRAADFAIEMSWVSPFYPNTYGYVSGKVIKDRTGAFCGFTQKLEKILEKIHFLMKDMEKTV